MTCKFRAPDTTICAKKVVQDEYSDTVWLYGWLFDLHMTRWIALSVLDSYLPTIRSMYSPIRQGSMDKTPNTSAITKQEPSYTGLAVLCLSDKCRFSVGVEHCGIVYQAFPSNVSSCCIVGLPHCKVCGAIVLCHCKVCGGGMGLPGRPAHCMVWGPRHGPG